MTAASRLVSSPNTLVYEHEDLYTLSLFESPILEDAQLLVTTLEQFLRRGVARCAVIDLRGLRKLDAGPFLHVSEPMIKCRVELCALVKAAAILHTGGMAAASVAGGISMALGDAFPIKTFTEVEEAFRWLQVSPHHASEYEKRVANFRSAPSLIRRCRAELANQLTDATLESCAEHLEISVEELSRELKNAHTSFRAELRAARIEAAKSLLVDSSMTTVVIGEHVGYRKQQNFTDAFRKATGMTPGAWRKQQRAG